MLLAQYHIMTIHFSLHHKNNAHVGNFQQITKLKLIMMDSRNFYLSLTQQLIILTDHTHAQLELVLMHHLILLIQKHLNGKVIQVNNYLRQKNIF